MIKTIIFISDPTEKLTIFTEIVIDCSDKIAPKIKSKLKMKMFHKNKRISKDISERDKIHRNWSLSKN